jgi:signal transduction histidine kinase/ligand-binding sensor domain-containing protein/DNA-binding response OmpR family regulator
MFFFKTFFISFLCCISIYGDAQKNTGFLPAIEETWLPHQSVRALFQDANGNIWAGTNAGLFKYNLNTVVNYNLTKKASNRLLNNTIHCINEDNVGNILVGTESGLGILNPSNGDVKVVTQSDETVTDIIKGQKGVSWFVTGNRKIFRLLLQKENSSDPAYKSVFNGEFNGRPLLPSAVFEVEEGKLLIGTAQGLFLLQTSNGKLTQLNFSKNITALYAEGIHSIFVGTAAEGLFELRLSGTDEKNVSVINHTGVNKQAVPGNYITAIKKLRNNQFAIATPLQVMKLSKENEMLKTEIVTGSISFNEASITDLLTDKTGNIWIGSKKGLYKMRRRYLDATYISVEVKEYKQNNFLTDIFLVQPGIYWLLTSADGIYKYNAISGVQEKLRLNILNCRFAKKGSNGNIFLAADDMLIEIDASQINSVNPSFVQVAKGPRWTQVNDMVEVIPGEWWISSWNGGLLKSVKEESNLNDFYTKFKAEFTDKSHLFAILKDVNDNVWMGTRGEGIVKLNLKNGVVSRYNKFNKSSDRILCLREDSKGRIWVGTRGDGLQLYQPSTDNFRVYDEKNGLPSNTISAIEEDSKGELWVSTLNGVAVFQENQFIPFQSFTHEDGISNAEFTFNVSEKGIDGKIYFGSGNGFYRLQKPVPAVAIHMPVVFTHLKLLNTSRRLENNEFTAGENDSYDYITEISKNSQLHFKHNQNSIAIGFTSLDFTTPEKNRYVYRLTGKDDEWKLVQGVKQQVQYIDLPPGSYTFEVKAYNNEGAWASQAQTLSFSIMPSFWVTTYAYVLYTFFAVIVLLAMFFLRRRWYKLNRQLEKEIESSKVHNRQMVFYTDLSHEIKNRLSLLLGPLEQALTGKKVNPQILNNLYEQGLRLKKLTDQIMDIRKSESGGFMLNVAEENIKTAIQQIVNEAAPLAVVKNITLLFNSKKESIKGWCDEELLEIIIMNMVNNAIKYCKPSGTVEIKIDSEYLGENDLPAGLSKEGNYLSCTVTDTGIGIAKNEISKILEPYYRAINTRYNKKDTPGTGIGLDLVARLIHKHHGSLDVHSELNEFTTVNFYLPVDKAAYSITELKPDIVHAPIILPAELHEHINEKLVILPDAGIPLNEFKRNDWNILVVDDNEEIFKLLEDSLKDEFCVYQAENGKEALEILQQEEVHLIISDLDMPVMDGLTLCCNVRALEKYRNLPFLILTGRNSDEQKLVCFQNQVDDFIEKPFSAELLKWKVKSYLRNIVAKVKLKTVMVVEPKQEIRESEEDKFIQDIVNLIEKNLDKDYLGVDYLAENMYTSRATFYRRMEQMVGESPSVFIRKYRLKKAALFLQSGNCTVNEVSYKTGFSNPKYFSKCFQKEFGASPAQFINYLPGMKN